MAYKNYALVKSGFVFNLIVLDKPSEEDLETFRVENDADEIIEEAKGCTMGALWDGVKFTPPRPFDSWVLTADNEWEPPIPKPVPQTLEEFGYAYSWNESEIGRAHV